MVYFGRFFNVFSNSYSKLKSAVGAEANTDAGVLGSNPSHGNGRCKRKLSF
jgi:hypothetical protein